MIEIDYRKNIKEQIKNAPEKCFLTGAQKRSDYYDELGVTYQLESQDYIFSFPTFNKFDEEFEWLVLALDDPNNEPELEVICDLEHAKKHPNWEQIKTYYQIIEGEEMINVEIEDKDHCLKIRKLIVNGETKIICYNKKLFFIKGWDKESKYLKEIYEFIENLILKNKLVDAIVFNLGSVLRSRYDKKATIVEFYEDNKAYHKYFNITEEEFLDKFITKGGIVL